MLAKYQHCDLALFLLAWWKTHSHIMSNSCIKLIKLVWDEIYSALANHVLSMLLMSRSSQSKFPLQRGCREPAKSILFCFHFYLHENKRTHLSTSDWWIWSCWYWNQSQSHSCMSSLKIYLALVTHDNMDFNTHYKADIKVKPYIYHTNKLNKWRGRKAGATVSYSENEIYLLWTKL